MTEKIETIDKNSLENDEIMRKSRNRIIWCAMAGILTVLVGSFAAIRIFHPSSLIAVLVAYSLGIASAIIAKKVAPATDAFVTSMSFAAAVILVSYLAVTLSGGVLFQAAAVLVALMITIALVVVLRGLSLLEYLKNKAASEKGQANMVVK